MLETIVLISVLAVLTAPVLIVLYAVKAAGEDAIREYADQLRKGGAK